MSLFKKKLIDKLSTLKKEKKLDEKQYRCIYPTSENVPRLYCTPKIHKQTTPLKLRPIVDYTGSIAYETSKMLANILQPLVGQSGHHVSNSRDFTEEVTQMKITDGEIFNSHDVVSLFTKTPIPDALKVIEKKLLQDTTLHTRTKLTVCDIISLLEFVLNTTYFTFEGKIFQQKFGAAMGSPVSPIVANLYMEWLEVEALSTSPEEIKPRVWKRYVDDIFEVVKRDSVDKLTEHINSIDKTGNIKFTHESEQNGQLPFLDTLVTRDDKGDVHTKVYQKKSHTDQFLNYKSHHPLHQKMGVATTLLNRAITVTSKQEDIQTEEKKITNALNKCGYPEWLLNKAKRKVKERTQQNWRNTNNPSLTNKDQRKKRIAIPYIRGISEATERIFRKYDIATAMKPCSTLRKELVHPKDKVDKLKTSGVIYGVPCKDCDAIYIGETGRPLATRIKEHKKEVDEIENTIKTRQQRKDLKGVLFKSAITDHAIHNQHTINWEETRIKDKENTRFNRVIKESICIMKEQKTINRDSGGYKLPKVFGHILN